MTFYAYMRVSTSEQTFASQFKAINDAKFDVKKENVFTDKITGVSAGDERPGWSALMNKVKSGDTVVGYRLDRLGRDTQEILARIQHLFELGIQVQIVKPAMLINPHDAFAKFQMTLLVAFADLERSISKERQRDGIDARKEAQKKDPSILTGRRPLSKGVREKCYSLYLQGISVYEIRQTLKKQFDLQKTPSARTIYNIINEYKIDDIIREEVKAKRKALQSGDLVLDGGELTAEEKAVLFS